MATGNDTHSLVDIYCKVMGWDDSDATSRAEALVGVQAAYNAFLTGQHPDIPSVAHPWSFLRQIASIAIPASKSGTVDYSGSSLDGSTLTVATLGTSDDFAEGDVTVGILIENVGLMRVTSYEGVNEVDCEPAVQAPTANEDYLTGMQVDLPANFGGMVSVPEHVQGTSATRGYLQERAPEWILRRLYMSTDTGTPEYFAIVPVEFTVATGQRYAMMVYPIPDAAYLLQYRYRKVPAALVDDDDGDNYQVGGVDHQYTIEAAVRAEAEFESRNKRGPLAAKYVSALMASIGRDEAFYRTAGRDQIRAG